MSRTNHKIFLAGFLSFIFFFSFFQSSQAGFFDWFRWFRKSDSQNTTRIVSSAEQNTHYSLSISKSGSGIVISDDGKINCGKQCKVTYPANSKIVLKAEAGDNYKFERWNGCNKVSDGQCQTTLNKSKIIVAKFASKNPSFSSSSKSSFSSKSFSSKSFSVSSKASSSSVINYSETNKNVFIIQDDGSLIRSDNDVDIRAVARKFFSLYPDKKNNYDFLSIFTTFHKPSYIEIHDLVTNNVKGIALNQIYTPDGFPQGLLGINFLGDTYSPTYNKTESEVKNNLDLMIHETGHQWGMYLGVDEGISDGVHYSNWVDNGFQRDGKWWGDAMGGWPWKQNNDGTYSVNHMEHIGFSKLSLYLMGFVPISEVSDLQIIVPSDPNEKSLVNIHGSTKIIKISDIITKYGERIPSYQNSQKNFRMAYILLTKKGEINYQSSENVINWVAKHFPNKWNFITYGKSTINQE